MFNPLMTIAQRQGRMVRDEAVDFFDRMNAEKRFHADVWGITLNLKQVIEEVRDAKYNQGENWLHEVSAAELPGKELPDQVVGAGGVAVTST